MHAGSSRDLSRRHQPAHAVPVLDDAGFLLAESHAIRRYLCQRYGGERFYPADAARRALVDQWLDWNHCKPNPPVQSLAIQLMFMGDKADPSAVQTARRDAGEALPVLDDGLAIKRGIGERQHSLADIAIATHIGALRCMRRHLAGDAARTSMVRRTVEFARLCGDPPTGHGLRHPGRSAEHDPLP